MCGLGKYSAPKAKVCTKCRVGFYCMLNTTTKVQMETEFICPAGQHCPEGMEHQPYPQANGCNAGQYCVQGDEVSRT